MTIETTPMSDLQELQDTLVAIQEEIDQTVGLITRSVSSGQRDLIDVAQQLKAARAPIVEAQLLVGVVPRDYKPTKTTQLKRVHPGPLGRVVSSGAQSNTPCPYCGISLRPSKLEKHMQQTHRQNASAPETRKAGAASP